MHARRCLQLSEVPSDSGVSATSGTDNLPNKLGKIRRSLLEMATPSFLFSGIGA